MYGRNKAFSKDGAHDRERKMEHVRVRARVYLSAWMHMGAGAREEWGRGREGKREIGALTGKKETEKKSKLGM